MGSSWTDSLGIALMGAGAPHAAAWARAAEQAGLGSLWLIEDYFQPGAFALAGAAAAVTERVTIGLGVVNPYTRHPALLAMETAALAGAAPGRVVLGLGSSNRRWIEGQMGIAFKTPLADLTECVAIVRRLLAGERVGVHGERFRLDGVQLEFPPKADRRQHQRPPRPRSPAPAPPSPDHQAPSPARRTPAGAWSRWSLEPGTAATTWPSPVDERRDGVPARAGHAPPANVGAGHGHGCWVFDI